MQCESLSVVSNSLQPHGIYSLWNSPGQNTGMGKPFPSPRDLPNPGIKPRSHAFWQILYQLSHKGSPRILEWVAYPFSSGSSWPRNLTGISCIAGGFFTTVHPVCSVMSIFVDFLSLFSFVDLAYIGNSAINTFVCLYRRSEIIRLKRIWICTLKILLDYFPKKVVVRKSFSQTRAS